MIFLLTTCLVALGLCNTSFGVRPQRNRGIDELAPELHRDHPHRQRTDSHVKYAVCFHADTSPDEFEKFESIFNEFIIERLPNFDLVHVEIPLALVEDVTVDIRSQSYVKVIENFLMLHSHDIYWNKARGASNTMPDNLSGNQEFYGSGFDADIYIIDT
eukprot:Awhi_evm1s9869